MKNMRFSCCDYDNDDADGDDDNINSNKISSIYYNDYIITASHLRC